MSLRKAIDGGVSQERHSHVARRTWPCNRARRCCRWTRASSPRKHTQSVPLRARAASASGVCSSGAARLAFLGPPPSSPSCFSAGIFVTSSPKLLLRTACERPALHRRRSHRERWLELVVLFPSAAAAVAGGDASRFISMGQSKAGSSVAQADGTDCEACRRWRWRKEADCRVERSAALGLCRRLFSR